MPKHGFSRGGGGGQMQNGGKIPEISGVYGKIDWKPREINLNTNILNKGVKAFFLEKLIKTEISPIKMSLFTTKISLLPPIFNSI